MPTAKKKPKVNMGALTAAASFFQAPLPEEEQPKEEQEQPISSTIESTPTTEENQVTNAPVKSKKPSNASSKKTGYSDAVSANGIKLGRPRKKNKNLNFQLSFPEDFHARTKAHAAAQDKSLSEYVRQCIEFYESKNHIS